LKISLNLKFEEDQDGETSEAQSNDKKKHLFLRECNYKILIFFQFINFIFKQQKFKVKTMMYGFGDEENPLQESVELLESLVIHFVQNTVNYQIKNSNLIVIYIFIFF
jgi:hypothetical protein